MVHGSKTERGVAGCPRYVSQRCWHVGEFQGPLAGTVPSPYKKGVVYLTNGGRMCCLESSMGRKGWQEKRDEEIVHRKGDNQPPDRPGSKYTGDRPRRPPACRPEVQVLSTGPVVAAFCELPVVGREESRLEDIGLPAPKCWLSRCPALASRWTRKPSRTSLGRRTPDMALGQQQ